MTWRKCVYCGQHVNTRKDHGWTCHAHRDLPALDPYHASRYELLMPRDVQREDSPATREKGA